MRVSLNELELLHSKVCRSVGDVRRLQLLYALEDGALPVNSLVDILGVPQPTVSRHLSLLRQNGLLKTERSGTQIFYSLSDKRVIHILDTMRQVLHEMLEKQTEKLDDFAIE
ncbi:MAG: metalloregulator ArsR/SmtB family transcription factor [Anaerolineae bacterium]|jgi:ArsR family transcriptional regulator|nr:metalloregulator ArsR/SmtB family transcription factor [Anaerolineae bacterium]